MAQRVIHVLRPGLLTTVQDLGRWGLQAQGVPVAGPMDPFSHRCANALVGNSSNAATLEITLVGPELEFDHERMVAITGARFAVTVNGSPVPAFQPFVVSAGARMEFGARSAGARAYLAVAGGIDVPPVLGSRATHVPSGLGGWQGRALQKGDCLPVGGSAPRRPSTVRIHPRQDEAVSTAPVVRALRGPDSDRFGEDAFELFQSVAYAIEADSDRMGFRLRGPAIPHVGAPDIISDATATGTVQVPGSGTPILLMADRQTTGGYPRLATVISADIGVAGQCAPGDRMRFRICSRAEALAALIARERTLLAIEAVWR